MTTGQSTRVQKVGTDHNMTVFRIQTKRRCKEDTANEKSTGGCQKREGMEYRLVQVGPRIQINIGGPWDID